MAGPVCGANLIGREGTCSKPAGWQTEHPGIGRCKFHGGSTPNHQRQANRILIEKYGRTYGVPRDVSPLEGLLEEIRRTAGAVDWLWNMVAELEPSAVTYGLAELTERDGGQDAALEVVHRAGINTLVSLLMAERKHYVDAIRVALANDVDSRLVNLEELRAGIYAVAIERLVSAVADDVRSRAAEQLPGMLEPSRARADIGAMLAGWIRQAAAERVPHVLRLAAEQDEQKSGTGGDDPPMPLD